MADDKKRRAAYEQQSRTRSTSAEPRSGGEGPPEQEPDSARNQMVSDVDLGDEATDIALAAVDELADQAAEIERLQSELKSMQEQVLRRAADFQNFRKRAEEEIGRSVELGQAQVLEGMLEIADDLQRSLDAAGEAAQREPDSQPFSKLREGVALVFQKFTHELGKFGVEAIESVGKPFNVNEHEALMQQPAPEGVATGTVLAEVQKGYKMGSRVLRHAKVIVSA